MTVFYRILPFPKISKTEKLGSGNFRRRFTVFQQRQAGFLKQKIDSITAVRFLRSPDVGGPPLRYGVVYRCRSAWLPGLFGFAPGLLPLF